MPKILLVDDDKDLLVRIASKLQYLGHECRAELTGTGALEFLKDREVDIIVLDVMIPGVSGFELCRRLRRNSATAAIPVLFVSSMSSEEEVGHALGQGGDDFLAKPFHMDDLVRRIDRLLASRPSLELVDKVTGLHTSKAIKVEIQNRILEKRPFSLAYIQVEDVAGLVKEFGAETRDRVLRHFARAMSQCAEKLESPRFAAGHMGGGHFVALIEEDHIMAFCKALRKFWSSHLLQFYESINELARYQKSLAVEGGAGVPLLRPHICVTRHTARDNGTVSDLFEALSHVRQGAQRTAYDDIVVDRRVS